MILCSTSSAAPTAPRAARRRRETRRAKSWWAARALLVRYGWPGNVRELSNAIERAVVLGLEDEIRPEDLPETLLETLAPAGGGEGGQASQDYHEALNEAKRRIIRDALAASGGNVTRAAEGLGLHANHLHRLITSLGLR